MDTLCRRCLADADPDNGGCQHGDELCAGCALHGCRECEYDAALDRAERDADYDRENGAA